MRSFKRHERGWVPSRANWIRTYEDGVCASVSLSKSLSSDSDVHLETRHHLESNPPAHVCELRLHNSSYLPRLAEHSWVLPCTVLCPRGPSVLRFDCLSLKQHAASSFAVCAWEGVHNMVSCRKDKGGNVENLLVAVTSSASCAMFSLHDCSP